MGRWVTMRDWANALLADRCAVLLFAGSLLLMLLYLLWPLGEHVVSSDFVQTHYWLVDMNEEYNVPALYAAMLWLIAAFNALLLSRADISHSGWPSGRQCWLVMAAISLLLGYDEAAGLHEWIGDAMPAVVQVLPVYAWVFYGLALLAVVAAMLLPFVLSLSHGTGGAICLAGVIFVAGALGMETLGALVERGVLSDFPPGLNWRRQIALEEGCEMTGVTLLIFALRRHRRLQRVVFPPAGVRA